MDADILERLTTLVEPYNQVHLAGRQGWSTTGGFSSVEVIKDCRPMDLEVLGQVVEGGSRLVGDTTAGPLRPTVAPGRGSGVKFVPG